MHEVPTGPKRLFRANVSTDMWDLVAIPVILAASHWGDRVQSLPSPTYSVPDLVQVALPKPQSLCAGRARMTSISTCTLVPQYSAQGGGRERTRVS